MYLYHIYTIFIPCIVKPGEFTILTRPQGFCGTTSVLQSCEQPSPWGLWQKNMWPFQKSSFLPHIYCEYIGPNMSKEVFSRVQCTFRITLVPMELMSYPVATMSIFSLVSQVLALESKLLKHLMWALVVLVQIFCEKLDILNRKTRVWIQQTLIFRRLGVLILFHQTDQQESIFFKNNTILHSFYWPLSRPISFFSHLPWHIFGPTSCGAADDTHGRSCWYFVVPLLGISRERNIKHPPKMHQFCVMSDSDCWSWWVKTKHVSSIYAECTNNRLCVSNCIDPHHMYSSRMTNTSLLCKDSSLGGVWLLINPWSGWIVHVVCLAKCIEHKMFGGESETSLILWLHVDSVAWTPCAFQVFSSHTSWVIIKKATWPPYCLVVLSL